LKIQKNVRLNTITLTLNKKTLHRLYDKVMVSMLISMHIHVGGIMVVGLTTTYRYMQSVPITTDVVSSNFDQGKVHNIM
jgi:hypothetical protein